MQLRPLLAAALVGGCLCAQVKDSVSQKTSGVCSQAVVAGGSVTITCHSLDAGQREVLARLPKVLDQLLRSTHSDRELLLGKLEEISKTVGEIKSQTSRRSLTTKQKQAIATELAAVKGTAMVSCHMSDGEGCAFAEEFQLLLKQSGWQLESVGVAMQLGDTGLPGILVECSFSDSGKRGNLIPTNDIPKPALTVLSALQKAGLEPKLVLNAGLKDKISLHVGRKE